MKWLSLLPHWAIGEDVKTLVVWIFFPMKLVRYWYRNILPDCITCWNEQYKFLTIFQHIALVRINKTIVRNIPKSRWQLWLHDWSLTSFNMHHIPNQCKKKKKRSKALIDIITMLTFFLTPYGHPSSNQNIISKPKSHKNRIL